MHYIRFGLACRVLLVAVRTGYSSWVPISEVLQRSQAQRWVGAGACGTVSDDEPMGSIATVLSNKENHQILIGE